MRFQPRGQFHEDLAIWDAVDFKKDGRYVDIGANHPVDWSVTYALYEQGWRGITVEPVPEYAPLHRTQRPEDHFFPVAISTIDHHHINLDIFPNSGISTTVKRHSDYHAARGYRPVSTSVPTRRVDSILQELGWEADPIDLMVIDVEGAELNVLMSFDLDKTRPTHLVIEATHPCQNTPSYHSWEDIVLSAGYELYHTDQVNRFYRA